jgi:hypothetical protein
MQFGQRRAPFVNGYEQRMAYNTTNIRALAAASLTPSPQIANMPSRDTIVVQNPPELTTEADVKTFFDTG